jgi:hypothetical protein
MTHLRQSLAPFLTGPTMCTPISRSRKGKTHGFRPNRLLTSRPISASHIYFHSGSDAGAGTCLPKLTAAMIMKNA